MATKLHGRINLSKIPKELIMEGTDPQGNKFKYIWVDMVPKKNGPDKYDNTHSLQVYNKENRETTYLGDFKPQEFGPAAAPAQAPASHDEAAQEGGDDLPF